MKWLIFTGHSPEYEALGDLVIPNHRRYAAAHQYDLFVHNHERGNAAADAWDKARWRRFLQLLPLYDGIMTIGADALFMRKDITLDSIFPHDCDQQICEEFIGGSRMNNDVMLWRNAPSTVEIINWILDRYDIHMQLSMFGYQEAIAEAYYGKSPMMAHLNVVDPHVMNACPQQGHKSSYKTGDFIVHFMAADLKHKLLLAEDWLERARIEEEARATESE